MTQLADVRDTDRARTFKAARREVRAGLRSGTLTLKEVMREQPEAITDLALIDIIRMTRCRRNGPVMQEIGRRAVRDNINLMVPLGKASVSSRAWVARNGTYRLYAPRPSRQVAA